MEGTMCSDGYRYKKIKND